MTLTALQAAAYLQHLEFHSAAPAELAKFYSNVMDMNCRQVSEAECAVKAPCAA